MWFEVEARLNGQRIMRIHLLLMVQILILRQEWHSSLLSQGILLRAFLLLLARHHNCKVTCTIIMSEKITNRQNIFIFHKI